MSETYKIGDVVQLKHPPRGQLSSIQEQLFCKVSEYADYIRISSYTEEPTTSDDRLALVLEIFEGTLGNKIRVFPLAEKTDKSKTCFLENVISVEHSDAESAVEYVAVPISVNAMEDWIEEKVTCISTELAEELRDKKFQWVIGQDPRDVEDDEKDGDADDYVEKCATVDNTEDEKADGS